MKLIEKFDRLSPGSVIEITRNNTKELCTLAHIVKESDMWRVYAYRDEGSFLYSIFWYGTDTQTYDLFTQGGDKDHKTINKYLKIVKEGNTSILPTIFVPFPREDIKVILEKGIKIYADPRCQGFYEITEKSFKYDEIFNDHNIDYWEEECLWINESDLKTLYM